MTRLGSIALGLVLAFGAGSVFAQDNAIESISANQQGNNVVINVAMKQAPAKLPIGFSITNPARIALDFGSTANATGKSAQDINLGDVRGVNVVQAGERTRLVLNLKRPLSYAAAIDGKSVILTVEGSGGVAQAVNASGLPAHPAAPAARRPCATSTSAAAPTAKAASWSTCRTARCRWTCARPATRSRSTSCAPACRPRCAAAST
jgi:type IV pilus assembly protein PilQ